MNTQRTDIAAPALIDPASFTFTAGVYFGEPGEDFDAVLGEWMAEHDPSGEYGWHDKRASVVKTYPTLNQDGNFVRKGTCDHCGAWFLWGAVYTHTSGAVIVVGNVCADKTLSVPSRHQLEMNRLKSRIAAHVKTMKSQAEARAQAAAGGFSWLYDEKQTHYILADIARKGLAWSGLSDRQIELVKKIHGEQIERRQSEQAAVVREHASAVPPAPVVPVPVTKDRIKIVGTIVSTKSQTSNFYPFRDTIKMLVRSVDGFKVWGTLPDSLPVERGATVEFFATVEPSRDDPNFGFFKRPTKARVLTPAPAGV